MKLDMATCMELLVRAGWLVHVGRVQASNGDWPEQYRLELHTEKTVEMLEPYEWFEADTLEDLYQTAAQHVMHQEYKQNGYNFK